MPSLTESSSCIIGWAIFELLTTWVHESSIPGKFSQYSTFTKLRKGKVSTYWMILWFQLSYHCLAEKWVVKYSMFKYLELDLNFRWSFNWPYDLSISLELPYARNYNPWFIYFLPTFLKSKNVFSRGFFLEILSLCMVSIQERFLIKSGLWWRA